MQARKSHFIVINPTVTGDAPRCSHKHRTEGGAQKCVQSILKALPNSAGWKVREVAPAVATRIRVMTQLHDGIYESQGGGGKVVEVSNHNFSPRGLTMAFKRAVEERADNAKHYGSIGCGATWIEFDGNKVDLDDLAPCESEKERWDAFTDEVGQ